MEKQLEVLVKNYQEKKTDRKELEKSIRTDIKLLVRDIAEDLSKLDVDNMSIVCDETRIRINQKNETYSHHDDIVIYIQDGRLNINEYWNRNFVGATIMFDVMNVLTNYRQEFINIQLDCITRDIRLDDNIQYEIANKLRDITFDELNEGKKITNNGTTYSMTRHSKALYNFKVETKNGEITKRYTKDKVLSTMINYLNNRLHTLTN